MHYVFKQQITTKIIENYCRYLTASRVYFSAATGVPIAGVGIFKGHTLCDDKHIQNYRGAHYFFQIKYNIK